MQEPFVRAQSQSTVSRDPSPLHVPMSYGPSLTSVNVIAQPSWRHRSTIRAPAAPAAGLQFSAGCGYFRMVKLAIEHIVLLGRPHELALTLHLIVNQPCFRSATVHASHQLLHYGLRNCAPMGLVAYDDSPDLASLQSSSACLVVLSVHQDSNPALLTCAIASRHPLLLHRPRMTEKQGALLQRTHRATYHCALTHTWLYEQKSRVHATYPSCPAFPPPTLAALPVQVNFLHPADRR